MYGPRGETRRTPAGGVSVREFADRPITNVDMPPTEELAARIERSRSTTKSSEIAITSRLEQHSIETNARLGQQDREISQIKAVVGDMQDDVKTIGGKAIALEVTVARMDGKLDILPELVDTVRESARLAQQREHLTLTKQLEVTTARELSRVQIDSEQALDVLDARKKRRLFWLGVVGLFAAGGAGFELVRWLITRGT